MQVLKPLYARVNRRPVSTRSFGLLKDLFGTVRNEQGKLETASERLEKGWKQEHDRINQKYFEVEPNPRSEYFYTIQYLEKLEKESLKNYPKIKPKIQEFIDSYKQKDNEILMNFKDKGFLKEVTPMSFEDQQRIIKILAQEKGEESDYDSDVPVDDDTRFNRRLFNYIKVQDRVDLPPMREEDRGRKTLFIELDDLLIHTFIPDENVGYLANSASMDPNKTLFLEEARLNILYYERDFLHKFLDYIDKNFEPILFTAARPLYADYIIKQFDPEDKIFRHRLYQNSCYMLEKKDEDIKEFVKDITQFFEMVEGNPQTDSEVQRAPSPNKRSARTSLILDTKPLNFILNPDNSIPCEPFTADYSYTDPNLKDTFLDQLIDDLEEFKEVDDVREMSREKFKIVDNLYSSKLV